MSINNKKFIHSSTSFARFPGKYIFVLTIFLLSVTNVFASAITGTVVAVLDGNTIEVSGADDHKLRIVLLGVDCPEIGQEFGVEAKKYLESIALRKNVVVDLKGKDRNGNHLAIVRINGKVDAAVELLKAGLAWTSEKDPDDGMEAYRTWAQRKEKGLWKQPNPVPPWTYRRQQSMMVAKGS